ncbi:MAG: hypothetical protein EOS58_03515 [Mesorhizobium sp.]|uniref:DUF2569 family protein n=1 Tax=unclassified Mesorhizobium TaxID=325217 RepID=UPI000F752D97|nr:MULTISPECIES: DUF2569 family protein [unclassified Mesorhizobium]RVD70928.1 hypothetical protein EN751_18160 [Mesorhizobium sp. M4A.F.Ca.ET.029.04.2.1]AZO51029.1 hypothetical protein EJ073_27380 [Mesorhizobium sp. M4B.F.Ca.ET.058.02.1.1]RVC44255.1 hypothetical protein EN781_14775 [Mesorhizobium sp. M4A.F.Ca.ET.090.04.2.1]RVC82912.1 hypothetical protein EN745_05355 [Mesorhizobium sp. M4A.F.Ca.ET.022.05.2.1]RWC50342.1 MAG: hypothetical protein EOS54_20970 [Mesorhizobium sp.]
MTSTNQGPAARPESGLSYVPVAWLVIVMARSVYGLMSTWRLVGDSSLPESVFFLIYGGLVAGIVTILWGLYLLGLAFNRSARFPRHFTIWQVATILWLLAQQAYVLLTPDFVFSARSLVFTGGEIAIGLLCLYLLRRGAGADAVYANAETESPPVLVSVVAALLGIILGAAIGACAGFAAGSLIADASDMSCFEGACGYFAVFIGLAGLIIGAIAGGVFAVWRVNRRKRKPAV